MSPSPPFFATKRNPNIPNPPPGGLNTPGIAGRWVITEGISALSLEDQSAIREKVETFKDFSADNDPYAERDFGSFRHNGEKIFWKIDYYAPDMRHGSEDPSDPRQTVRVLTIMLAEEY